ncbi:hypothetical protein SGFS_072930 [Streptomyces graminofaciens]|uniref:Uncharacterized protein n=1 Tax=Streptomyces graminofaciens TaxID=68212 RepID=A0ABN5VRR8_9ACTN|nr:hypothetical protein SGFS_072930 [Streptomyces graminofaciens]
MPGTGLADKRRTRAARTPPTEGSTASDGRPTRHFRNSCRQFRGGRQPRSTASNCSFAVAQSAAGADM